MICKVCGYDNEDLKKFNVGWYRYNELCNNCAHKAPKRVEKEYLRKKKNAENFHQAVKDGEAIITSNASKGLGFLEQINVK